MLERLVDIVAGMAAFARSETAGAGCIVLVGFEDVFEEGGIDIRADFRVELREDAGFRCSGHLGVVFGDLLHHLLGVGEVFLNGRHDGLFDVGCG